MELAAVADDHAVAFGQTGEHFHPRIVFETEFHVAFLENVLWVDGKDRGVVAVANDSFQGKRERVGFLAQASGLEAAIEAGKIAAARIAETRVLIFNARLDAFLCGVFVVMVATILIDSIRVWVGILKGTREATVAEAPFVLSRLSPEEV